ncbi:GYF domain-containing protein [Hoeflea sp. G2-23]|uniref:GYF domain-containing protein n=1 Tax=Hoeflea algicola TaxID=2983763 RepID=A0ABT3ZB99_9HYPH|nr:GYF domain-containing protein [Hoeflea algicola]MCY0148923.1 GYF domain-containing protein [Hoeflea algicola]
MGDLVAHWYYVQSGEKKGPFAPDQIKTLIQAGVIDGHTSVWSEVSGEWKPLNQTELQGLVSDKTSSPNIPANTAISKEQAESDEAALSKLFDAPRETSPHQSKPTVSPPPNHQKTYDHNHFYRNNTLSSALRFFVWINIIIASGEFYGIYKVKNDINQSYRKVLYFESSEWLSVIFTPILIGVVLFMMWKYRSTANLIRLRGGQSVTAAGAVYWYFVPIAWFWKPYQAMRNLLDGYDIGSHRVITHPLAMHHNV